MFIDFLNMYINIIIIMLYIYILYTYDFKGKTEILLGITLIAIFLIYKNKKNIIEGVTADQQDVADISEVTQEVQGSLGDLSEITTTAGGRVDSASSSSIDSISGSSGAVEGGAETTESMVTTLQDMVNQLEELVDVQSTDEDTTGDDTDEGSSLSNNAKIEELTKRVNELEKKLEDDDGDGNVYNIGTLKQDILSLDGSNLWNKTTEEDDDDDDGGEAYSESLDKRKVRSRSGFKTTPPIGMYDSLCLDHLMEENIYQLEDEGKVNTYLGSTLPLKIIKTDNSQLKGPSVDGNKDSAKRLNMFETNKTSISCCDKSPYLSSNGCVCITSDQQDYLVNRGGNHI